MGSYNERIIIECFDNDIYYIRFENSRLEVLGCNHKQMIKELNKIKGDD